MVCVTLGALLISLWSHALFDFLKRYAQVPVCLLKGTLSKREVVSHTFPSATLTRALAGQTEGEAEGLELENGRGYFVVIEATNALGVKYSHASNGNV